MPKLSEFLAPPSALPYKGIIPWGTPEVRLSNNPSDAVSSIDFSAGIVVVGDGNQRYSVNFPALTKSLASTWIAGNGGGLGSAAGTKANSTWYYAFAIFNPSSNVADYLFTLSAIAPILPTGFTCKRRIGAIQTQSNGAIRPFFHSGDVWQWADRVIDLNGVAIATVDTAYTFTVPPGFPVEVLGHLTAGLSGVDNQVLTVTLHSFNGGYISPVTANNVTTPTSSAWRGSAAGYIGTSQLDVRVATANNEAWIASNGQLKAIRVGSYLAAGQTSFQTTGWRDISIQQGL